MDMQITHHNHDLLLRLPKHPTIAGWFWLCYMIALVSFWVAVFG